MAEAALQRAWKHRGPLAVALWPLSLLYGLLAGTRRWLYRARILRSARLPVPVIVVGNVIAGGAGKTPVTQAVVRHLQSRGWHPGIISRGYGRRTTDCREVLAESAAADVGDEPALLARSTGVPVFVAARRADAGRALLSRHPGTDVIVCDDGLQHGALARDVEICVFNDDGIGNGWLLPAGPLREPWPRKVDLVLHAGTRPHGGAAPGFTLRRVLAPWALRADGTQVPLQALQQAPGWHAVAAIARPQDFFAMLRAQGVPLAQTEALPDHYDFDSWMRNQDGRYGLICTEKDAVKLWPRHPDALAVPLQLELDPALWPALDRRLATAGAPRPAAA